VAAGDQPGSGGLAEFSSGPCLTISAARIQCAASWDAQAAEQGRAIKTLQVGESSDRIDSLVGGSCAGHSSAAPEWRPPERSGSAPDLAVDDCRSQALLGLPVGGLNPRPLQEGEDVVPLSLSPQVIEQSAVGRLPDRRSGQQLVLPNLHEQMYDSHPIPRKMTHFPLVAAPQQPR
jgi:hypothetical protein